MRVALEPIYHLHILFLAIVILLLMHLVIFLFLKMAEGLVVEVWVHPRMVILLIDSGILLLILHLS